MFTYSGSTGGRGGDAKTIISVIIIKYDLTLTTLQVISANLNLSNLRPFIWSRVYFEKKILGKYWEICSEFASCDR